MMYSGSGVAGRLLMQQLDTGHALALLGRLDPVSQADQALSDLKGAKQHQAQAHPAQRQDIEVQRLAVKEMQQSVIGIPRADSRPAQSW
jgi:hypothetical protein